MSILPHHRKLTPRATQKGAAVRALVLTAAVLGLAWAYSTQGHRFAPATNDEPAVLAEAQAFVPASARQATVNGLGQIAYAQLPAQGKVVYGQILRGGPFAFEKDGTVFGNFEQILPKAQRGYYREYTVAAHAKSRKRGAKRIVCGGEQPQRPDACFYTADHYSSFRQIVATP